MNNNIYIFILQTVPQLNGPVTKQSHALLLEFTIIIW